MPVSWLDRLAQALLATCAVAAVGTVALIANGPAQPLNLLFAIAGVVYLGVGVLGLFIVQHQPRNPAGWVFLAGCVGSSVAGVGVFWSEAGLLFGDPRFGHPEVWVFLVGLGTVAAQGVMTVGVLLFPDGRLPSRRWRSVLWLMIAHLCVFTVAVSFGPHLLGFPDRANPLALLGPAGMSLLLAAIVAMGPMTLLGALAVRRRLRQELDTDTRRALHLAAGAAWFNTAGWWLCTALAVVGALPAWFGPLADQLSLVFPVVAWIGIVRYRLLNVRLVASRTIAYLALSLIVLIIYLAAVAAAGLFSSDWVPAGIAVVASALLAVPLRDVVQRRVNLMLFGAGSDPAMAFHRLGDHLRAVLTADEALPAAVRTVADVLRLRFVAVEVDGRELAAFGAPADCTMERLPLPFAGDVIGHLVLAPRSGESAIDRTSRALLDRLAPQLAVTVQSALLTTALRDSRRLLIAARDEERLRIRRDLHDGLGPNLAGMVLGIEHAGRRIETDVPGARAALAQLHATMQQAVADVRRIVYALRPPVLDSLGLAGAVGEHAQRLGAASIDIDQPLPPIPATVELGAYLIALEAMSNAARHAYPAAFSIRVYAGDTLTMEVADGGPGLPEDYQVGIGIRSMRERAAELGGTLHITSGVPTGTSVQLQVPLPA